MMGGPVKGIYCYEGEAGHVGTQDVHMYMSTSIYIYTFIYIYIYVHIYIYMFTYIFTETVLEFWVAVPHPSRSPKWSLKQ